MDTPADYFGGLNEKLLSALPSGRSNVLEFGCANGRLGAAYKNLNPGTRWTGVEVNSNAAATASQCLDAVIVGNVESLNVSQLGHQYDLVVFGDVLEHLRSPEMLLSVAHEITTEDARLVCCVPNMGHVSIVERMLAGDLSYDSSGLLDSTHLRFLSWASTYKLLLDAKWLPALADGYHVRPSNSELLRHLVAAAGSAAIPPQTALRNLLLYQLIVDCVKSPAPPKCATPATFSVVVPVNRRTQFDLNIGRSPGVSEVHAELISVEKAASPAAALAAGRASSSSPWILFCHQDVYLPRGAGTAICSLLGAIPAAEVRQELIGFAGLTREGESTRMAGLMIDRLSRFDHPRASTAASIDEVAVLLHRDSVHQIDASLGWHTWATDLCLAAGRKVARARIERVPIFHNSYADYRVPADWHKSAAILAEKYSDVHSIATLCGEIKSVLPQHCA